MIGADSQDVFVLQVNLQQRMRITGVITQGARRLGRSEFVKTYRVAYGDDGKTWRMVKAKGSKEDMVNIFFYVYS